MFPLFPVCSENWFFFVPSDYILVLDSHKWSKRYQVITNMCTADSAWDNISTYRSIGQSEAKKVRKTWRIRDTAKAREFFELAFLLQVARFLCMWLTDLTTLLNLYDSVMDTCDIRSVLSLCMRTHMLVTIHLHTFAYICNILQSHWSDDVDWWSLQLRDGMSPRVFSCQGAMTPSPDSSAASNRVFIFFVCRRRSLSWQINWPWPNDQCAWKSDRVPIQCPKSIQKCLLAHHDSVIWWSHFEGLLNKHRVDDSNSCKANHQLVPDIENGEVFLRWQLHICTYSVWQASVRITLCRALETFSERLRPTIVQFLQVWHVWPNVTSAPPGQYGVTVIGQIHLKSHAVTCLQMHAAKHR